MLKYSVEYHLDLYAAPTGIDDGTAESSFLQMMMPSLLGSSPAVVLFWINVLVGPRMKLQVLGFLDAIVELGCQLMVTVLVRICVYIFKVLLVVAAGTEQDPGYIQRSSFGCYCS
ncbi:hypothetical protein Nepgr_023153 [Nepenthes gracilis]|uniref:Uncharacterized protein n=1 Tax=Nepenthes gracilis TaxID=150966 RepID=A0AAD3T2B1_NEPGR|nr:hypothetical protein Nepgr_023153 [Nepenthes gracilis]